MKPTQIWEFTYKGILYEARAFETDTGHQLALFRDELQISGWYGVRFDRAADFQFYLSTWTGPGPLDALFNIVKKHLRAGHIKAR